MNHQMDLIQIFTQYSYNMALYIVKISAAYNEKKYQIREFEWGTIYPKQVKLL